jgi:hypothetical protein
MNVTLWVFFQRIFVDVVCTPWRVCAFESVNEIQSLLMVNEILG